MCSVFSKDKRRRRIGIIVLAIGGTIAAAVALLGCNTASRRSASHDTETSAETSVRASPSTSSAVSDTSNSSQLRTQNPAAGQPTPIPPVIAEPPIREAENLPAINIEINDGRITLDQTSLAVGIPYRFLIYNKGRQQHSLELKSASYKESAPVPIFSLEGPPLRSGESRMVMLTFTRPGPYQVTCPLEGHRESGEIASLGVL